MTVAARNLTPGECALARSIFAEAVDYGRVRIHSCKYHPCQPRCFVLVPNGNFYVPPGHPAACDDYACAPLGLQAFFIHEMTHVWQHQSGRNLLAERSLLARYRYLPLRPGKPFARYGLEQQAEILRHLFLLRRGVAVPGAPELARYEALVPFSRCSDEA